MKRRDFLKVATSSAGLMYLKPVSAEIPCPPVLSGASGAPLCPAAGAEQDWQSRISGPGVVWYHDFRTDAEVDAFRWVGGLGNDPGDIGRAPNTIIRQTADGITGGGCLEMFRPAGSDEPAVWWRPLSPMASPGNGKAEDDPAADGTVTVETWDPSLSRNLTANWTKGYYGNSSFHASHPGQFDGTEYYFQVRVKMDPRRTDPSNPGGGKLFYFTLTKKSLTAQEIVTLSGNTRSPGLNYFSMYRSGGPPMITGAANQPNSDLGFCDWPTDLVNCWTWSNGWDTVLYHVRPGLQSGNDTIVRVWTAKPGETAYTKIWDQNDVDLPFQTVEGHNALIASGFMNGANLGTDIYHRYDQMIFSKEFIPCPQV